MKKILATIALVLAPAVRADEFVLYYETSDYSSMLCAKPVDSVVANLITHGWASGDSAAHGRWLEEKKAKKDCRALAPGQRFITSNAQAVYMRSLNDVRWVVQVLPPKDPGKPLGWIPLDHIKFLPIPTF